MMIAPHDPAEVVLHEDVLDYTPHLKSVGLARRRAARLVGEWGCEQLISEARLLLSELMTNAILHGGVRGRLVRVRITLTESVLRIAVTDARGERLPCPREAGPEDAYGRGLFLVREFSVRWGVCERSVGKTVWCEVERRSGSGG